MAEPFGRKSTRFNTFLINPVSGKMLGGTLNGINDRNSEMRSRYKDLFWLESMDIPLNQHKYLDEQNNEQYCAVAHSFNVMFAGSKDTDSLTFPYITDWAQQGVVVEQPKLSIIPPTGDPIELIPGAIINTAPEFINDRGQFLYYLSPASKYIPCEIQQQILDNDDVLGNMPGAIYISSKFLSDEYKGAVLRVENMYYYVSTSDIGGMLTQLQIYAESATDNPDQAMDNGTFIPKYRVSSSSEDTTVNVTRSNNVPMSYNNPTYSPHKYDVVTHKEVSTFNTPYKVAVFDSDGKLPIGTSIRRFDIATNFSGSGSTYKATIQINIGDLRPIKPSESAGGNIYFTKSNQTYTDEEFQKCIVIVAPEDTTSWETYGVYVNSCTYNTTTGLKIVLQASRAYTASQVAVSVYIIG